MTVKSSKPEGKPAHKKRSKAFRATRKHHSLEAAEDYTELIEDLEQRDGQARTCAIADHLGISHVTALRTIQRLQEEGYVTTARQKPVMLTAKGRRLAKQSKERHELLVRFLVSLGVPKKVAEVDVEGAEHHISSITLNCIRKYLGKI